MSLPGGGLSCLFAKLLVMNNMTLLWNGRVLVVSVPLLIGAYPPTLLECSKCGCSERATPAFQDCSSLLVDDGLIRDSAQEDFGGAGCLCEIGFSGELRPPADW
jgi:hypothetical protein